MLYNGNLKCVCWYGEKFIVGKIYECKEGIISNNEDTNIKYNEYTHAFEKVKPNKIELLRQHNYNLDVEDIKYQVVFPNENSTRVCVFKKITSVFGTYYDAQYDIRWGKHYNTTFEEVKPILDVLNIEIIENPPKYTIDSTKEYTKEETKELEKLGIKFKKVLN